LPTGRGLRQLGLAPPRLVVTLKVRGRAESVVLRLGGRDASGVGVYASGPRGQPVVVSKRAADNLDVEAGALRDRELVALSAAEVRGLSWRGKKAAVSLHRDAKDRWQVRVAGQDILADPRKAEHLVGIVTALRAKRFLPRRHGGRGPAKGDASPGGHIEVQGAAKTSRLRVTILGPCPGWPGEFHVEVDGGRSRGTLSACVEGDAVTPLFQIAAATLLYDRRLLRLRGADLTEVTLHHGDETMTLSRRGVAWRYQRGTRGGVADGERLRHRVKVLEAIEGDVESLCGEAIAAALGGAKDQTRVIFRAGRVQRTLTFGRERDGRRAFHRGGEAAIVWVPSAQVRGLITLVSLDVMAWRDREVLAIPSYEVIAVEVRGPGKVSERVVRRDGRWEVISPVRVAADAETMRAMVDRLGKLRAETFGTPTTKPWGRAELLVTRQRRSLGKKARRTTIRLGLWLFVDGRCGGRLAGLPPFILAKRVCDDLRTGKATRRLLSLSRGEIVAIDLRLGHRLRLTKGVSGWTEAGTKTKVPGLRVAALLDAALSLRAVSVLRYGGTKTRAAASLSSKAWRLAITGAKGASQVLWIDAARSRIGVVGRRVIYWVDEKSLGALKRAAGAAALRSVSP
ncbi:MAG: DUF4340 domain-containing protein, partial [Deltaproteobacteria bacterium]|nr:DUF4340 domain-containing protein [Deltaproteobacteria bacterium]